MLKLSQENINAFKRLYDTHKVHIAAANVFYQNIRLVNNHHKYVSRMMYHNTFLSMLSDIELVTPPTDAFVPSNDDECEYPFIPNQLTPEYMELSKRVTLALLEDCLGSDNEIVMTIKDKPEELVRVHDDIYTYFMLFKWIDQIDIIRLKTFSNFTPVIEYIVDNITLEDWKNKYLYSNKKNIEKYIQKCEDLLFNPDFNMTQKYYNHIKDENTDNNDNIDFADVPKFNVQDLMIRLVTNTTFTYDIYLCLGVYLIISFAMSDFKNKKVTESKCAQYVVDVLSKL